MKIVSHSETDHFTKSEKQSLVLLAILFVLGLGYVFQAEASTSRDFEYSPEEEAIISKQMTDSRLDRVYESLELKGQSVFIYNADTHEPLYSRSSDMVMPLASLTKVMTAIVALEHLPEDSVINISQDALRLTGDNGLLVDEKWKRDDLIRFMLITSSNDAARALAFSVGEGNGEGIDPLAYTTRLMNETAERLHLSHTTFLNESGLDVDGEHNGGYSTAREMVELFHHAIVTYPDIFASTSFTSEDFTSLSEAKHTALNTNPYTGSVAGISASKTGFTNISGGNLIISFTNNKDQTTIAVVLGSTFADRFTDIEKVAETTLRFMNQVQ